MQLKAGQALESEHRNREMQRRESRQTRSSKRKSNNNDNEDKNPKKPRKISPEKKLSSKEYNDLCAKLSKSDPNDTCTLRDNHKNHKIKDCNNLKRWKERQASNKNTTECNAIQMFDEDSTTSKESASSNEGMSYIQDGTYCSKSFETTFSHHIDLCPFDSLNDTVSLIF